MIINPKEFEKSDELREVVSKTFNQLLKEYPQLNELNLYDKRTMHRDLSRLMDYLMTAVEIDEPIIFANYNTWLYLLLARVMDYLSKEEVLEIQLNTLNIFDKELKKIISPDIYEKAHKNILEAIASVEDTYKNYDEYSKMHEEIEDERVKKYIELVLDGEQQNAIDYIISLTDEMEIGDILVDILQVSMFQIGEMWLHGVIDVDQEHYATYVTQKAMAQFYPEIFKQERIGKTIVTTSIGSELHEMGISMIADIFELNGWDAVHLGAGTPESSISNTIENNKPQLVALSVTMPNHLRECKKTVDYLREKHSDIVIAVGGMAFNSHPDIWENFDVNIYTTNANELYNWAEENIS